MSKATALSAWERWEMRAIADAQAAASANSADAVLAPLAPALLIDEAELVRLRLQAQQAGASEGHKQGYAQGLADGQSAALVAEQAQAARWLALTEALPAALRGAEREVADNLLALALALAQQVVGQALKLEPQLMLPLVRELLQAEPALSGAPQLLLHAEDAALVKEYLTDDLQAAGWRIRIDAQCQRGGCRVLASSGERDASLPSRWERVAATLARQPSGASARQGA